MNMSDEVVAKHVHDKVKDAFIQFAKDSKHTAKSGESKKKITTNFVDKLEEQVTFVMKETGLSEESAIELVESVSDHYFEKAEAVKQTL